MDVKFYYCRHCGKVAAIVNDTGTPTICCGDAMVIMYPKTNDLASEKHVPVIEVDDDQVLVTVGSTIHPREKDHYIEWILLQTSKGLYKKWIGPEKIPQTEFHLLPGEKVIAAFTWCNIHKLWKCHYRDPSTIDL